MRRRRCAAAAIGLLVLAPTLVACGDDGADLELGDVVPARNDDQFTGGVESYVVLPRGKLEVTLGEPATQLSANDTRQLEEITAPEGSTFVPLTLQYDAATFGDYASYLTSADTPALDLVVDGAPYRLPAPAESGEGSTSFYVLVSGSGKAPSLKVEFDGVSQTLDLTTGEREAGQAEALYELKAPKDNSRSCTKDVTYVTKLVAGDFACSVRRVVRLPYAGDAWAEQGHVWLGVTVRTSLRSYTVVAKNYLSGAVYYPVQVAPTFTLGKVKSTAVAEDPNARSCPDPQQGGCTTVYNVVFDLAKGASTQLNATLSYDLTLTSVYGGAEAEDLVGVPVKISTKVR